MIPKIKNKLSITKETIQKPFFLSMVRDNGKGTWNERFENKDE